MKRFLIAVLLQLLTLNISVHASLRVIVAEDADVSSGLVEYQLRFPDHQDIPPVDDDGRDTPLQESEDDISYAHSGSIAVLIPIFAFYPFVHPDQHGLEGPHHA